MQRIEFGVKAERWVRRRLGGDGDDPPFALDEHGFLFSPADSDNGWLRPSVASASGGWVLLGEPGSGKTTTFETLIPEHIRSMPPQPGESGTVWVTGSDLADATSVQDVLGVHLDALPELTTGSLASAEVVVVIDQLDESPFLRQFPQWLRRKLAPRSVDKVRIWLACRTAEYRHELTKILEDALGSCVVGDLAPLTRQETAELVASTGTDAQVFLDIVVDNTAGVLASLPLTLKVLLSAYRQDAHALQAGPRRLFDLGLAALVDEHDSGRIPRLENTSREQRLAIAARIAVHLLLSGRRTIHTGWVGDQTDQAVPMGAVIGQSEFAGAGEFTVTKPMVNETLATALFSHTSTDTAVFAHSSFAAFLTGRYLAARLTDPAPMPIPQLTGLFLVSAPDEDTAAIPEHLRETAAWLVAHAPDEARWLAAVDPEGLVGHSATITAPQIRALLVDGLLQRADRIEIVDRSWQRARWQLAHPGLADQLSTVLIAAADNPNDEWVDLARARLAVRLARDSGLAELAEPLLRIAEVESWPVGLRQSAAKAAMSASPAIAAPRLRTLLATLTPPDTNRSQEDESDGETAEWENTNELVGTLLQVLWPDHLSFADALPHIQPVTTRHFLGMYLLQVRQFPQHVTEGDLPALLTHTEETLRAHGVVVGQPDSEVAYEDGSGEAVTMPADVFLLGHDQVRNLRDFVVPVVDRVLYSEQADVHLARVARILLWFLSSPEPPPLPAAVDVADSDGVEPEVTTTLRRRLAEELLRAAQAGSTPNHHAYWTNIVAFSRWGRGRLAYERSLPPNTQRANRTRLLDADDANWATTRSQHYLAAGEVVLAETFTRLASALTDARPAVPDESSGEEDSASAWDQSDEFATLQRQRLDRAVAGDPAAFWLLVRDLTANPKTGQYDLITSWDIIDYPGARLWPDTELRDRLPVAALHYLSNEHDHRDTWLGTTKIDWRAFAGYFALVTLHAADPNADIPTPGLTALSDERWASWIGAILYFADHFGTDRDLAHDFIGRAGRYAPTQLSAAVDQYVRTHVSHASTPLYLPDLPPQLTPVLTALAAELLSALRATQDTSSDAPPAETSVITEGPITVASTAGARDAAVTTWTNLLRQPLRTGDPAATDLAWEAITDHSAYPDSQSDLELAAAGGYILLTSDAARHWDAIHDAATSSEAFARELAFACASHEDETRNITEALPEAALAQLYRWLAVVCPPDTNIFQAGFSWVSPERRIHDWRRNTVSTLASHGTPEAVHQLRRLTDAHPERLDLRAALLDARRGAQAAAAGHLTPSQVTALLNDRTRRVVHTAAQLADVAIDTIGRIAADLHTHSNLLWDCERVVPKTASKGARRTSVWRPKPEGALSAYIAHELTLRLARSRIVVNREVVIHPTDEGDSGERPDIKIDATALDNHSSETPIISIPIEIKGAWHQNVLEAQDTQLAQRYIPDMNTTAGVYLVGWYPLDHWTTTASSDRRKTDARRQRSADTLLDQLNQQATTIHTATGRRTHAYVLNVPRATQRE